MNDKSPFRLRLLALALLLGAVFASSALAGLQPRAPFQAQSWVYSLPADAAPSSIIVKFKEDSGVRLGSQGFFSNAAIHGLDRQLDQALQQIQLAGMQAQPLFPQSSARLEQLRKLGQQRSGRQLADLRLYFELPVLAGVPAAQLEQLLQFLNSLPVVEVAYAKPEGAGGSLTLAGDDSGGAATTPDFHSEQGYLDAAPAGIDAFHAWSLAGGRGESAQVIDIELAWNIYHEDLPVLFHQRGSVDTYRQEEIPHGTAVLGVIGALDNGSGMTGIASAAQLGIEGRRDVDGRVRSYGDILLSALEVMGPGGIALNELHFSPPSWLTAPDCSCSSRCGWLPAEFFPDHFDAIQTATANGLIVVQIAGNGEVDLDDPQFEGRFDRSVRDSGAILVGASESGSREPACFSNYGSRIDVHAWGRNVATTGNIGGAFHNGDDPDRAYTRRFSGTSSAGAIVTGAVASLQGIALAHTATPLDSQQMRELLSSTGSAQTGNFPRRIGPMPDLRRASDVLLGHASACRDYTASNQEHEDAGRAYRKTSGFSWWSTITWYAVGSDENLGTSSATVQTLKETTSGHFVRGECPEQDDADTVAPVITLLGDNPMLVAQGSIFADPGATAHDDVDGDISDRIVRYGAVNTEITGSYSLRYTVADAAGNEAEEVIRTVIVEEAVAGGCQDVAASAADHISADRAYACGSWSFYACAMGSGEEFGSRFLSTAVALVDREGNGDWRVGSCN